MSDTNIKTPEFKSQIKNATTSNDIQNVIAELDFVESVSEYELFDADFSVSVRTSKGVKYLLAFLYKHFKTEISPVDISHDEYIDQRIILFEHS